MNREAVDERAALQRERSLELARDVGEWLRPLTGSELVLDAGCGTGAFALAIAGSVRSVVGVDADSASLEAAGALAPANVRLLEGDVTQLELADDSFDIVGCFRVMHHVAAPERVVAELARLVKPTGRALVVDQLREREPAVAEANERFERERDASHTRTLHRDEIIELLESSGLDVVRSATVVERRELERFLDLAGLAGDHRERVRALAPAEAYDVEVGWFLARPLQTR
jgi:ubiquinone/menaquinone biosynthesis C-methylase UbiE